MISGYTIVRNAIALDYPIKECVYSLIPGCSEVVICDSDSTDGTPDLLRDIARSDSRVRLLNRPWPNPVGDPQWFIRWINWTRARLKFQMQLQLDADEILDPASWPEIHRAAQFHQCRFFDRLNFWADAKHLVPDGQVCGRFVARLGPSDLFMPSDEPYPDGEPVIKQRAKYHGDLRIFHYGFLRRRDAFYAKSKVVQKAFFNTYDKRLERAEAKGTDWVSEVEFEQPLIRYDGQHPEVARPWLKERGHL